MSTTRTCSWAFAEPQSIDCTDCYGSSAILQCIGCGQISCSTDSAQHREKLNYELKEIINKYSDWEANEINRINLFSKIAREEEMKLIEKIENWRKDSIKHIDVAANHARNRVHELYLDIEKISNKLITTAHSFKCSLDEATRSSNFHEQHLKRWKYSLGCLQDEVKYLKTNRASIHYTEPFISKLVIDEGDSDRKECIDIVEYEIKDYIPDDSNVPSEQKTIMPFSLCELQSGTHRFEFKNRSAVFRIRSLDAYSGNNAKAYSITDQWNEENSVSFRDIIGNNNVQSREDWELSDTFLLEVNCDEYLIVLTNQHTKEARTLKIDPNKFPLPWSLDVRFIENIRV